MLKSMQAQVERLREDMHGVDTKLDTLQTDNTNQSERMKDIQHRIAMIETRLVLDKTERAVEKL